MGLYLVSPETASSQPTPPAPCRCCPGGMSRSTCGRRYPSDMSDAVIEPLLPAPGWLAGQGGSPGTYCRRDFVDGIRYLVQAGPAPPTPEPPRPVTSAGERSQAVASNTGIIISGDLHGFSYSACCKSPRCYNGHRAAPTGSPPPGGAPPLAPRSNIRSAPSAKSLTSSVKPGPNSGTAPLTQC